MTKNISSLDPKQVGKDCNIILNARMERLKQCIDECKELLKKEDFNNYKMPEIPSFDIDIPIHEETLKVDLKDQSYQKIKGELDYKLYQEPNWLLRLRENFKNGTWYDQKWKAKDMSKAEFEKKFGKSAPAIKEMARDMGLTKSVIGDREKLKKNIHRCMHEIESHFDDINERLKEGIKEFVKDVDDCEKYRKDIQMLEQEEEFIWEIETKIGVFSATEIVSVIYRCKDRMKNLAKLLFDDSQEEQIKKYLQACDKRDSDVINAAIDNAFCRFFHSQSVEEGVIRFVERFPELNIDLDDEIFEKDIITKAAKYGDIMLQIIDENYRNAAGRR